MTGGRQRRLVLLALLVGLFIGGLLLAGPPVTDDTLALGRFLTESGLDVRTAPTPPAPAGTFVLLQDVRDREQVALLLQWVEDGGRLVVADPASEVLGLLGVRVGDRVGLVGTEGLPPSCPAPEAVGVRELVAAAGDVTLQPSSPDAVGCFVRPGGSYAVFLNRGGGRVAFLGGPSFLTNDLLDRGDNAVLALRLFGNNGPIVFGPPAAPGTRAPALWELLPRPARLVLVQIAVAAVLFALARARRLGKPVTEEPVAPIPASELVRATAGLYRRARAAAFCGGLLRRSASERLARRIGAPPGTPGDRLAELVSGSSGLPTGRVHRAMAGPEPRTDQELLALAGELSAVTHEIEGTSR